VHILFDFDGVLLDSRENMRASWMHVREEFNLEPIFEEYFQHVGKPFPTIMRELRVPGELVPSIQEEYARASLKHEDKLQLFPGVAELLARLHQRGSRLALLTSKDEERSRRFLELFDLPIEEVYSPSSGLPGKPAPDLFEAAAAAWAVRTDRCWYVGDMAVDAAAATAAGARYIHCEWGYGNAPADVEIRVRTCQGLAWVLDATP
jgi:HAD superfamily hydrolase (TIGR01509 family)